MNTKGQKDHVKKIEIAAACDTNNLENLGPFKIKLKDSDCHPNTWKM